MKLALARAMLLQADVLLLDEPTNHMDTTNVAWLVNYLTTQVRNATCNNNGIHNQLLLSCMLEPP